jgi:hypothetical protein
LSLQNLLRIGRLTEHSVDKKEIAKLMAAAERYLGDARQETISCETRLAAAYRAIVQYSTVALSANGYRPSKSAPGHHQTMIQSLTHSVKLDPDQMLLLDTFRVKRNAIAYTGEDVDESSVEACIEAAEYLRDHLNGWLADNRPNWLT